MKLFPRTFVLTAALLASAAIAHAQQPTGQQPAQMDESMKLSMAGPGHEPLKLLTGAWVQSFSYTMGPGMQPITGTGTFESVMILGNRFLQTVGMATAMGTSVGSLQIIGFDNRKQKYFLFTVDEMGTYAVTAEGDYNAATKTFTLKGTEVDGNNRVDYTIEFQIVNPNEFNSAIHFHMQDGTSFTAVKINSKRKV